MTTRIYETPNLPPGRYSSVIDRVRKVRNKQQWRFHGHIVDGPYAGFKFTYVQDHEAW